jgi:hypothetical protein
MLPHAAPGSQCGGATLVIAIQSASGLAVGSLYLPGAAVIPQAMYVLISVFVDLSVSRKTGKHLHLPEGHRRSFCDHQAAFFNCRYELDP